MLIVFVAVATWIGQGCDRDLFKLLHGFLALCQTQPRRSLATILKLVNCLNGPGSVVPLAMCINPKRFYVLVIDLQNCKLLFFDASVFNFLRLTRWKDCLRACRFEVRDNFGPANMIISMFRLEYGLFCQIIDLVSWVSWALGPLVPSFCLFQHQTSHRIGD